MRTLKFLLVVISIFSVSLAIYLEFEKSSRLDPSNFQTFEGFWEVRCIDTMKYSRDLSLEKKDDDNFDLVIDKQVSLIAQSGATHVAIGTPYDDEFLPMMKRWVGAARKHGLKVWFRGNFSGWEGWFGYPGISRREHLNKTQNFIEQNQDLFEDGDIFSSCPECENGGSGDPRQTGDVQGHRDFLIKEYRIAKGMFNQIGKDVKSNYVSMNADVARLIMDKETTRALEGLVVIDHYVKDSQTLLRDVDEISSASGGKIVLGEFGAPIPDIHGQMSQEEQARWIKNSLHGLVSKDQMVGINYWLGVGGTTELWDESGNSKKAAGVVSSFYDPYVFSGAVRDEIGHPVKKAKIDSGFAESFTDSHGYFVIPSLEENIMLDVETDDYESYRVEVQLPNEPFLITLRPKKETTAYRLMRNVRINLGL